MMMKLVPMLLIPQIEQLYCNFTANIYLGHLMCALKNLLSEFDQLFMKFAQKKKRGIRTLNVVRIFLPFMDGHLCWSLFYQLDNICPASEVNYVPHKWISGKQNVLGSLANKEVLIGHYKINVLRCFEQISLDIFRKRRSYTVVFPKCRKCTIIWMLVSLTLWLETHSKQKGIPKE